MVHYDQNESARAEVSAARAAEHLGDYRHAAKHYVNAGSLVGGTAEAWAYHEAAVAFRRCEDLKAALAAVEIAAEAASATNRTYLRAQVNLTASNILADLKRWREAAEAAQTAQQIFKSMAAFVESQYAHIALARCLPALGDKAKAFRTYRDLAGPRSSFEIRTQALNNLAILHSEVGDNETAIKLIRDDILLCREAGASYGEFVAQVNLAQFLAENGNVDDALYQAKLALTIGQPHRQTASYDLAQAIIARRGAIR